MKNSIRAIALLFLSVHLSQAQVTFEKNGQSYDSIIGRGVALGDLNEDGFIDAFVSSQGDGFQIYFGDDARGFSNSNQTLSTTDNWWGTPAVADIDQDGRKEVVTGRTVWIHDSAGQFTANTERIQLSSEGKLGSGQLADLNKDGYPDLFAIINYTASRVFLNDGTGRLVDSGQELGDGLIGSGQIADVTLGDINNDGNVDAVVTGWRWNGSTENPNQVWINNGAGQFTLSDMDLDEGGSHVHGLTLHDLNGDGWLDLIMAIQDQNRSGRIYMNDGFGKLIKGNHIGSRSGENINVADFNGDGIEDIFIAQSTPPSRIWLNDGSGKLTDSGAGLGSFCFWDSAVEDFNQDGKPDIFAMGFNWLSSGLTAVSPEVWLNTSSVSGIKTGWNHLPSKIQLHQNNPNPFNPATVIGYQLPEYGNVKLKVHDILGRDIKTLVDSFQSPGEYSFAWNGQDDSGNQVGSGMYFYSLVIDDMQFHKKMMLIR